MKRSFVNLILFSTMLLAACGGGNSGNVNGTWTASLTNPDGSPAFNFTTSLTQNNGTNVSGTNINFTTSSPCFSTVSSETGGFTLSGNTNGVTTGSFELTIQSGTPSGNVMTLNGTLNNNTITGTWTLTGVTSGCTGNGNFTMNR
jgi:hypothetical protein